MKDHNKIAKQITCASTGEVYEVFVYPKGELIDRKARATKEVVSRSRNPYRDTYVRMFKQAWIYLRDSNLSGVENKIFYDLMARLDYQNWIAISQETIAEDTGLQKQHVSRAMKKLLDCKIIERQRDPHDRRRWRYRLNADLGWMGDGDDWVRHQRNRAKDKVIPMPGVTILRN